jgi:hypothetical protein
MGRYFDEQTSTVFTDNNCVAAIFAIFFALVTAGLSGLFWLLVRGRMTTTDRAFLSVMLIGCTAVSGVVLYLWPH